MTVRDHLVAAAAMGDTSAAADLRGPSFPAAAAGAWGFFLDLSSTRGHSAAGLLPITHVEMRAWQENTGQRLTPLDVAFIRVADQAFLADYHERLTPTDRSDRDAHRDEDDEDHEDE